MRTDKLKILLVEDDRIEVLKLKRSIAKDLDNYDLSFANNGKEAFERIEEDMPNLILLDLNMPDTNGIEFMQIMKGRDDLLHIPVIILTTSNNEKDIHECYKLGIAGYLLKPLKYEEYEEKINAIFRYWSLNEFLKY